MWTRQKIRPADTLHFLIQSNVKTIGVSRIIFGIQMFPTVFNSIPNQAWHQIH